MKKSIIKSLAVIFILVMLCRCSSNEEKPTQTTLNYMTTEPTTQVAYNFQTEEMVVSAPETTVTAVETLQTVATSALPTGEQTTQQQPTVTNAPTQAQATEAPTETTEKIYEKTGEMAFSDKADNKFIKSVANKYSVDSKNLVALYTVPENDGNIVLEFDGTTDSNGKLIRNADTLIAIYTIDKNLNSKRASEDKSLNEYSRIEMKAIFVSTTNYIMPEFEAELNG